MLNIKLAIFVSLFTFSILGQELYGQKELAEWEAILQELRVLEKKVPVIVLDPEAIHPASDDLVRKKYTLLKTIPIPPKDREEAVKLRTALSDLFSSKNVEKRFYIAPIAEKLNIIVNVSLRNSYLQIHQEGAVFLIKRDKKQPIVVSEKRRNDGSGEVFISVNNLGDFGPEASISFYIGLAPITPNEAMVLITMK